MIAAWMVSLSGWLLVLLGVMAFVGAVIVVVEVVLTVRESSATKNVDMVFNITATDRKTGLPLSEDEVIEALRRLERRNGRR